MKNDNDNLTNNNYNSTVDNNYDFNKTGPINDTPIPIENNNDV